MATSRNSAVFHLAQARLSTVLRRDVETAKKFILREVRAKTRVHLTACRAAPVFVKGKTAMQKLSREIVGGESYQYYPLGNYVVRALGVCGGRPTFKYTRIEITGTLERLAAGENIDDIVAGYRGRVSREAVIEAIQLITNQLLNFQNQSKPNGESDSDHW